LIEELADARDILYRHWHRVAPEPNKPHNTRDLQYTQAIVHRHANKNIAGEKRQLEANLAVFPLANRFVLGQEVLDPTAPEVVRNTPLLICARVDCIPARLNIRRQLWLTVAAI
jgi:hypothetical protein